MFDIPAGCPLPDYLNPRVQRTAAVRPTETPRHETQNPTVEAVLRFAARDAVCEPRYGGGLHHLY
jgi:hypothetical protein